LDNVREANVGPQFSFEPNQNLDAFVAAQLAAPSYDMADVLTAGQGQPPLTGRVAGGVAVRWGFLHGNYSYYNNAINKAAALLGIQYALYLGDGGRPLTDVIAKFAPDSADAGTAPDRQQSLHDNLLGNLHGPSLIDKLLGAGMGSDPSP